MIPFILIWLTIKTNLIKLVLSTFISIKGPIILHHHHHHQVELARHSLTRFFQLTLSSMAFGSSSNLHPVSSDSWSMYVFLGRPCDLFPCLGFQSSTSAISSSLLCQQCPANLILCCRMELLLIFGMFPYSSLFVGGSLHDLFSATRSILV